MIIEEKEEGNFDLKNEKKSCTHVNVKWEMQSLEMISAFSFSFSHEMNGSDVLPKAAGHIMCRIVVW